MTCYVKLETHILEDQICYFEKRKAYWLNLPGRCEKLQENRLSGESNNPIKIYCCDSGKHSLTHQGIVQKCFMSYYWIVLYFK